MKTFEYPKKLARGVVKQQRELTLQLDAIAYGVQGQLCGEYASDRALVNSIMEADEVASHYCEENPEANYDLAFDLVINGVIAYPEFLQLFEEEVVTW
jgi:hypothetical protein